MKIKKYLYGPWMLQQIEMNLLHEIEKGVFLILIFTCWERLFPSPSEKVYFQKGSQILILIGVALFSWLNSKVDKKNIIERYCALFIVASITSFIFLIPGLFILEFCLKRFTGQQRWELVEEIIIYSYLAFYPFLSLWLWRIKRAQNLRNLTRNND